jgi:predicted Zn-dependent protease with MMP-like domain
MGKKRSHQPKPVVRTYMSLDRFETLVSLAIRDLPEDIRNHLENVAIVIEERPSPEDLMAAGVPEGYTLFGLYLGTPLSVRTSDYGLVLPDKITIYKEPLEDACGSDWAIRSQVQKTVQHELAHHLGFGDEDMGRMGLD